MPSLRSYLASTSKDIEVNVSADEVTLNGEKKCEEKSERWRPTLE